MLILTGFEGGFATLEVAGRVKERLPVECLPDGLKVGDEVNVAPLGLCACGEVITPESLLDSDRWQIRPSCGRCIYRHEKLHFEQSEYERM